MFENYMWERILSVFGYSELIRCKQIRKLLRKYVEKVVYFLRRIYILIFFLDVVFEYNGFKVRIF